MTLEHSKELIAICPDLFNTAWGFECGDGWFDLLKELIIDIKELQGAGSIRVLQVKEKFGGLRFYVGGDFVEGVEQRIYEAERVSERTCEECGSCGILRGGSWIKCLCDEHAGGRSAVKTKENRTC